MFCPNCGAQVNNNAAVCIRCGCAVVRNPMPPVPMDPPNMNHSAYQGRSEGMVTATKVFLIIGCVSMGWMIIPLAWCLPITITLFRNLNEGLPINTGLKICTLLFVSLVAGILLLCMNEPPQYNPYNNYNNYNYYNRNNRPY